VELFFSLLCLHSLHEQSLAFHLNGRQPAFVPRPVGQGVPQALLTSALWGSNLV